MRNMGNMEAKDLLQALLKPGRTLDFETGFSATTSSKKQKKVQGSYEALLNHTWIEIWRHVILVEHSLIDFQLSVVAEVPQ